MLLSVRTLLLGVAVLVVGAVAPGCGPDQRSALDTLPPIHTTTSTTTTTLAPDDRIKYYVIKPGDNINDIARKLRVPRQAIVDLNDLPAGGGRIRSGQQIQVPTDVVMIDQLPTECDCEDDG